MATLTVQTISISGIAPSFTAASAAGDEFPGSGKEYIHVKNSGTTSITVTINSQAPCSYGFDHDVSVIVPNGEEKIIGPFPKNRFNDANGKVQITYSSVTSVTIGVFQLP